MQLRKLFFLFLALSVTGISCSSSDNGEDDNQGDGDSNEITLTTSTNAIKSDGKDYCEFTVKAGDTDVTQGVEIYRVDNPSSPLSEMRFTSTQEGAYKFFAAYNGKVSSQISIEVLSTIPELPVDPQPSNLSFRKRVLATQFTGTGCPNCPYMIGAIHEVAKTEDAAKVLFAAIHSYNNDDIMYTRTVATIGQTYGNGYYPGISCNLRKNVLNAISSISVTAQKLKTMINEEYSAGEAKAGISASAIKAGNQIIVKANVKAAVTGQYRIAGWILEDGIYARQSNNGVTGDYDFDTHNNVVRTVNGQSGDYDFTGNSLGEISAGQNKSFVMSFPISSEWKLQNCKILFFVSTPDDSSAKKFYINNAILCKIDQVTAFEYK